MFNRVMLLTSVALAVLVVFLARQNLELKRQLVDHEIPPGALAPGDPLGPIQLLEPNGVRRALTHSTDNPRTALLFFTPTCPACRATLPVWRELIESLQTPARIVGINLAGPDANPAEELVTVGWPFPVFGVDPEQSEGLRDITHVPTTVIVDASGIVQHVWFGELDDDQRDELKRALLGG